MPVDNTDIVRSQLPSTSQHMAQQRLACEQLQHLRQVGAHTRSLAGGENDDAKAQIFFLGSLSRYE